VRGLRAAYELGGLAVGRERAGRHPARERDRAAIEESETE